MFRRKNMKFRNFVGKSFVSELRKLARFTNQNQPRTRQSPNHLNRKKSDCVALCLAILACGGAATAQTPAPPANTPSDAKPGVTNVSELPPVVVTASPLPSSLFDQAQPVTVLSGQKLQQLLAPTIGETLAREPGINSSYYGPNASRPVIRGLDGDHIRMLQNGVGNIDVSDLSVDHAVSQDPLTVTKIEVVRGPAALLYGPTAVGGVVNVIDNRIPDTRILAPITGRIEGRYTSVDTGRKGAGVLEGGYRGFNYHLDGFLRANDNASIPGFARSQRLRADPANALPPGQPEAHGTLPDSQARSDGGVLGGSYVWEKGYAGAAYQAFNTDYGTPQGTVTDSTTIRMFQRRYDLAGAFYEPVGNIQSIKWKLGYANYHHTEIDAGVPATAFKTDGLDGRLEVAHKPFGLLEGAIGYEAQWNKLKISGAESFMPYTDSLMNSPFFFEELKWDKVRLQFGGRLDHSSIHADPWTTVWTGTSYPARSKESTTGSGAVGLVYRPVDNYSAGLNVAYTQRAPIHQELFADGPHGATFIYEKGNPNLKKENSVGMDLTLRREKGFVTGSATFFYTRFNKFISLTPTGTSATNPNDPAESLPIWDYVGVPAEFLGSEAQIAFHLVETDKHKFHLDLKGDYLRATNPDTDAPLPRISPFRYGGGVTYEWRDRFTAFVDVLRVEAQNRVAANELPTDGYVMLDAGFSYRLLTGRVAWDLLVKGTNLLDEEARNHVSFLKDLVPMPGRGALVALRASF